METLAKLANDLCEETQSVALEAQASPDVLRTMAELYKQVIVDGIVNLAGIRAVVQAVQAIPVIGNGDVITAEAASKMNEAELIKLRNE